MLPLILVAAAHFRNNLYCFQRDSQFTTNGFKTGPDRGQFIKRCTARNGVDNGAEANKQCFDTFTTLTYFLGPIRKAAAISRRMTDTSSRRRFNAF